MEEAGVEEGEVVEGAGPGEKQSQGRGLVLMHSSCSPPAAL